MVMTPDKPSNELVSCTRIPIPLVTGGQCEQRLKRLFRQEDSLE